MKERLTRIRESERKSHIEIYTNEKLYNTNSWLQKPIKTVEEILPLFDQYKKIRILDLGCGVGRNSIYAAERFLHVDCRVDCVDLLEIAIQKLLQNAREHQVISKINGIHQSMEEYEIKKEFYDLIMAVSALEHIETEKKFSEKLQEIKEGVSKNGIVCLVINSNIREMNLETKEEIEPQFEVNLATHKVQKYLEDMFSGWEILKSLVSEQEYDIPRENFISHLHTEVVTYVMRCK